MRTYFRTFSKYADFSGRASRKEYWTFVLINAIGSILFLIPHFYIIYYTNIPETIVAYQNICSTLGTDPIHAIFVLVMLTPSLAVTVRRLHDQNKSGSYLLLALLPVIGGIWLLILMLRKGNEEGNEFGEGDY